MIRVFTESKNSISLYCPKCQTFKTISTKDTKFAYPEINKFRGEHEHLEELRREV